MSLIGCVISKKDTKLKRTSWILIWCRLVSAAFSSILRHSLYTSVVSLTSVFYWSETEKLANVQRLLLKETGNYEVMLQNALAVTIRR
ncbi:hypothetical protein Tco_0738813 [Tanacetum coccineum]